MVKTRENPVLSKRLGLAIKVLFLLSVYSGLQSVSVCVINTWVFNYEFVLSFLHVVFQLQKTFNPVLLDFFFGKFLVVNDHSVNGFSRIVNKNMVSFFQKEFGQRNSRVRVSLLKELEYLIRDFSMETLFSFLCIFLGKQDCHLIIKYINIIKIINIQ